MQSTSGSTTKPIIKQTNKQKSKRNKNIITIALNLNCLLTNGKQMVETLKVILSGCNWCLDGVECVYVPVYLGVRRSRLK